MCFFPFPLPPSTLPAISYHLLALPHIQATLNCGPGDVVLDASLATASLCDIVWVILPPFSPPKKWGLKCLFHKRIHIKHHTNSAVVITCSMVWDLCYPYEVSEYKPEHAETSVPFSCS